MSRIGKLPVSIPAKVTVSAVDNTVKVEGPKGRLEKTFKGPISIVVEDGEIRVSPRDSSRFAGAMHGTARSILAAMVQGVVSGFTKDLEIQGTGFKAVLEGGNALNLSLGYSHPVIYPLPEGIKVTIVDGTKLKVEGVDKHLVGQVAADIFSYYPAEPYKGKGVRIVGRFVRRKEGKKAG